MTKNIYQQCGHLSSQHKNRCRNSCSVLNPRIFVWPVVEPFNRPLLISLKRSALLTFA